MLPDGPITLQLIGVQLVLNATGPGQGHACPGIESVVTTKAPVNTPENCPYSTADMTAQRARHHGNLDPRPERKLPSVTRPGPGRCSLTWFPPSEGEFDTYPAPLSCSLPQGDLGAYSNPLCPPLPYGKRPHRCLPLCPQAYHNGNRYRLSQIQTTSNTDRYITTKT